MVVRGATEHYAERVNSAPGEWPDRVAAEVRAWMARRHRSGRSIALELGWTEIYLSRRLTGKVPFDVADLAMIADLLEVPVTTFFNFPEGVRTPGIWTRRRAA